MAQARLKAMAVRGDPMEDPEELNRQVLAQQREASVLSALGGALSGYGDKAIDQRAAQLVDSGEQASKASDSLRRLVADNRQQANIEQHQRTTEDLQRRQLEQGRWSLSNPGYGQTYKIDGKTGAIIPVGDERARPPPGSGGDAERKIWKDFSDSISTVKGRANLNAENQKRLYSSERIKALVPVGPNGEIPDLTPQQLQELGTMSAQLAGGNSPAEHSIQAMLPKGMGVKGADIAEWLTNDPHGAGQQAFTKMMLQQAEREEKVIHGQLLRGQTQALPNYAKLRGQDKVRFDSMLQGAGIDPELIDDNGLLKIVEEAAAGGGLPAEKAARLAELRKKKAEGTLK